MTNSVMTFYKIGSHRYPGMYRMASGRWNKSGKVYDNLGKVRQLITLKIKHGRDEIRDWFVVEFHVTQGATRNLHEIVTAERLMDYLKQV